MATECILLKSTKRQAKEKGLDPKAIYCTPDQRAICTPANCPLLIGEIEDEIIVEPAFPSSVDKFYIRLEKHTALLRG